MASNEHAQICENCDGSPATMTVVITNSGSAANLGYGCDDCTFTIFEGWWRGDAPEWDGLEIKRMTRWVRCTPALLREHPRICIDGERRIVGERLDGTCEYHEHSVEVA